MLYEKDLVKVPVVRERCAGDQPYPETITTEGESFSHLFFACLIKRHVEYITVNWTISFTGRQAYKAGLADFTNLVYRVEPHAHNATEYERLLEHHNLETLSE
jgi:hypothetical protein